MTNDNSLNRQTLCRGPEQQWKRPHSNDSWTHSYPKLFPLFPHPPPLALRPWFSRRLGHLRLDFVPPPSSRRLASGCLVSYRTPLINPLLQRLLSLFASKSHFQHQGPLNIPQLTLYPTALPAHYHFHGPMSTSTIPRASCNFELGTSESKNSPGPRPSSRETFLGPGDAERVRFPSQRYVWLGRCFRKAFGPKKYHTHLLYPLLRTAVRALWGAYQCYNPQAGAETSTPVAWARSCGRIRHWDWDGRTRLRGAGLGKLSLLLGKMTTAWLISTTATVPLMLFQTHRYPTYLLANFVHTLHTWPCASCRHASDIGSSAS